jgi:MFS family permease
LLGGVTALGSMVFLLFGSALLARLGPVRSLQWGALAGSLGLLVAAAGSLPALLLGALLLGLGYGPTPPAGSRILAATAPVRHRALIFSVKQAGAPLGGAVAGLLLPPVAARFGWPAALLLAGAMAGLCALVIQPCRATLDVERDPGQPIGLSALFGRGNLLAPFGALRLAPGLLPLTALGCSFALVQGALFTFTVSWLVAERGLSLVAAGGIFAVMQGAGVLARVALGWLADRTGGAARNLVLQGFAAAAAVVGLVLLPASAGATGFAAMAFLCGALAASWNGIMMAEVARRVPGPRIADATSGSTMLVFAGYALGPPGFALLVRGLAGWDIAFLLVAGQLAVVATLVGLGTRLASRSERAGPASGDAVGLGQPARPAGSGPIAPGAVPHPGAAPGRHRPHSQDAI